jgi:hypothetical protein
MGQPAKLAGVFYFLHFVSLFPRLKKLSVALLFGLTLCFILSAVAAHSQLPDLPVLAFASTLPGLTLHRHPPTHFVPSGTTCSESMSQETSAQQTWTL